MSQIAFNEAAAIRTQEEKQGGRDEALRKVLLTPVLRIISQYLGKIALNRVQNFGRSRYRRAICILETSSSWLTEKPRSSLDEPCRVRIRHPTYAVVARCRSMADKTAVRAGLLSVWSRQLDFDIENVVVPFAWQQLHRLDR